MIVPGADCSSLDVAQWVMLLPARAEERMVTVARWRAAGDESLDAGRILLFAWRSSDGGIFPLHQVVRLTPAGETRQAFSLRAGQALVAAHNASRGGAFVELEVEVETTPHSWWWKGRLDEKRERGELPPTPFKVDRAILAHRRGGGSASVKRRTNMSERKIELNGASINSAIERIEQQHAIVEKRDALGPGQRWTGGRFPSDWRLDSDDAPEARKVVRGLTVGCNPDFGGCGGMGYVTRGTSLEVREACPLCLGVGRLNSRAMMGILAAIRDALDPPLTAEASPQALAAWNEEAAKRHAARVEADRIAQEKKQRAERARDLLAEADPDVLARALQQAKAATPATRK